MKKLMHLLILVCLVPGLLPAGELKRVPKEYLDSIVDDNPNPLPRGLAPGEEVPQVDYSRLPRVAPSGTVRTPAEYEKNDGMFISWGSFNSLLTDMTVAVTTGTDATVWIAVYSSSQQSSATSTLTGAGADMSQVEFIIYSTNTVWMRDYGPRFISEDSERAIVDHTYNRPRPSDDGFPDYISTLWSEAQYDIPLTHGGGNFHLFSDGDAFMTELILDENSGVTEEEVEDLFADYEGVDLTILPPFPTWYDSTQHIDMWMLPVADKTVIIGEYPLSDTEVRTVTEDAVTLLEGRGYTVYRTPGWSSGGVHYTYTNSVILNEIVLTCQFQNANASWADEDADAVATFTTAFPDRTIVPVDCSDIIGSAGAVHCIVMHVPHVDAVLFQDGFESADTLGWSFSSGI